jgi:RecG-like helicase
MIRKLLLTIATAIFAASLALPSLAADEKTITGEGKCGKCALKETKSCQNVVQVKEKDKTVTYYITDNDLSKKFHDNLCKETKKVTVTGTVKTVNGKQELTPTKMELVKQ